jgi:hypothetical protein
MAPDPVFIQTEPSLTDLECDCIEPHDRPGDVVRGFEEFMEALRWAYEADHGFRTLAVDSADWLGKLIDAKTCDKHGVQSLGEIEYFRGPGYTMPYWGKVRDALDLIRRDRKMTVILIAHARIEKFANPMTASYDRFVPSLHKEASHLLREWCTEVLFATHKVFTSSKDAGFNKTETKGVGSGERVLYTTERPGHIAKNRLNLPDEIPLDWRELAKYLPGASVEA